MSDITITKDKLRGSYELSTITYGFLVRERYYGFTKNECLKLFRQKLERYLRGLP